MDAGRRPLVGVENCAERGQRMKKRKRKVLSPSSSADISDIGGSRELNGGKKTLFVAGVRA